MTYVFNARNIITGGNLSVHEDKPVLTDNTVAIDFRLGGPGSGRSGTFIISEQEMLSWLLRMNDIRRKANKTL